MNCDVMIICCKYFSILSITVYHIFYINAFKFHDSESYAKRTRPDKVRISHEYKDNRYAQKVNFNAPQLSKRDKEYLSKLEDALQSKEGKILYTNSWAVQLNPAEVAQADRIAEKHGFENLGQVITNVKILSIRSALEQ